MSQMAQSVQKAVDEMRPIGGNGSNGKKKGDGETMAKAREPREKHAKAEAGGSRPPRAKKIPAEKVRSVTSGIREAPKLKGLLLGTDISRTVVGKALKAAKQDDVLTEAETREADRLLARLKARG